MGFNFVVELCNQIFHWLCNFWFCVFNACFNFLVWSYVVFFVCLFFFVYFSYAIIIIFLFTMMYNIMCMYSVWKKIGELVVVILTFNMKWLQIKRMPDSQAVQKIQCTYMSAWAGCMFVLHALYMVTMEQDVWVMDVCVHVQEI